MENSIEISEERFIELVEHEKVMRAIIKGDIFRNFDARFIAEQVKTSLELTKTEIGVCEWARNKYAKYCIENIINDILSKLGDYIMQKHRDIIING